MFKIYRMLSQLAGIAVYGTLFSFMYFITYIVLEFDNYSFCTLNSSFKIQQTSSAVARYFYLIIILYFLLH